MRTTLFIIVSFFVLNAFPKISIAQESKSTTNTTTERIQQNDCDSVKYFDCLLIQIFNKEYYQKSALTKLKNVFAPPTFTDFVNWRNKMIEAYYSSSDQNRFHDPESGENYVWDSKKKAWIDAKTGECICPKCESTKENTEEPRKETTGKKTAMIEKRSSGNFEICGGVGYGFSFNGGLLGQNRTFTATDRTFDGVYGSWAQGENFFIKMDFKVSSCIDVGAEFDYTYGKNIIWDQNTIGATTTTDQHYEGRYTGYSATPFIQFNPCGSNRFSPYVDLGLRLNFSNTIKQNYLQTQTSNNNTTTTVQKATLNGAFSPGIDAALGAKYSLSNRLAILAELYSSNSNFVQDKATLDKYTINGTDQLGTLNTSQKQTNYVKSFTVPTSGGDPNSPSQALRSPIPLSTIGIKFGLDYKF